MVDVILNILDFNEGIDYSLVTKLIIGYLILLWVFVSFWVYNDSKSRFEKRSLAFLFALLNLFLSFPFLLIYLLIRPNKDEWDDLGSSEGGINIPVVNFTGKEGVVISLQLKINTDKLSNKDKDFKLDISLDAEDDDQPAAEVSQTVNIEEKNGKKRITFRGINSKMNSFAKKQKSKLIENIKKMNLVEKKKAKNKEGKSTETQDKTKKKNKK